MKRVLFLAPLLFFSTTIFVFAYASPGKPQGFVNDFAKSLSAQGKNKLEQKLFDFSKQTGIEVAVVTIPTLADETIENYAVKLFEEWGIGGKEKNNGALFLIVPSEHQVRIEVGYGLEGVLTDAQSNGIIQGVVLPEFKKNDLEKGITDGTDAIVSVVKSEADYSTAAKKSSIDWEKLIYLGWFVIVVLGSILARTKSWWLGGVLGGIGGIVIGFIFGFIFTGIISIIVLTLLGLLFDFIVSNKRGGGGSGGGFWPIFFGGGRGGSSGGGFGGFGGGMSGGGGSSGRW